MLCHQENTKRSSKYSLTHHPVNIIYYISNPGSAESVALHVRVFSCTSTHFNSGRAEQHLCGFSRSRMENYVKGKLSTRPVSITVIATSIKRQIKSNETWRTLTLYFFSWIALTYFNVLFISLLFFLVIIKVTVNLCHLRCTGISTCTHAAVCGLEHNLQISLASYHRIVECTGL